MGGRPLNLGPHLACSWGSLQTKCPQRGRACEGAQGDGRHGGETPCGLGDIAAGPHAWVFSAVLLPEPSQSRGAQGCWRRCLGAFGCQGNTSGRGQMPSGLGPGRGLGVTMAVGAVTGLWGSGVGTPGRRRDKAVLF